MGGMVSSSLVSAFMIGSLAIVAICRQQHFKMRFHLDRLAVIAISPHHRPICQPTATG
jgi:hypothetical protein